MTSLPDLPYQPVILQDPYDVFWGSLYSAVILNLEYTLELPGEIKMKWGGQDSGEQWGGRETTKIEQQKNFKKST